MANRKKSNDVTYEFISILLINYKASVDSSINHEVRDTRHHYADPKIYSFGTMIELEGVCDYAHRLFGLFPHAVVLATGNKAQKRLRRLGIDFVGCGAVTKPGCNFKKVKDSWPVAGEVIKDLLQQQTA